MNVTSVLLMVMVRYIWTGDIEAPSFQPEYHNVNFGERMNDNSLIAAHRQYRFVQIRAP
ncbi:MAG: hypothetical protein ACLP5H_34030 [Desulfomonilaceae bacterium]